MELRVLETDAVNRRIVLAVTQMPEPPKPSEQPAPVEATSAAEEDGPVEEETVAAAPAGTEDESAESEA